MSESAHQDLGWIISTTDETFEQEVFARSQELPVVVDFWAAWCQPCRLLAPLLERLAEEYAGRFVLAKANTDQTPRHAAAFGVQGIPAVYAVIQGEVVDFFAGLLPEDQLRAWLDRVLLSSEIRSAQKIESIDPPDAERRYRQITEQHPHLADASIGLARVLLRSGRMDDARHIVEQLESRGYLEADAQKLKAELEIGDKKGIDVEELRRQAEASPRSWDLQLQLGEALAAHGQHEEALKTLLEVVAQDKQGVGEKARHLMVDIFRILPDDSPVTASYRRKLSAVLF